MAETANTKSDAIGEEGSTSRRLARVYAESLMNAADKAGKTEAIEKELDGLLMALTSNLEVNALLSTKALQRSEREPLLKKAFENHVEPLLFDFIQVLNKKDRLELLPDTAIGFRELLDEKAHRIRVLVKSVQPLTEQQKTTLMAALTSTLHGTPVLDLKIEPELLGGLVVQVGDEVYDNSVRTRIDYLRNQLLSRSSHEIQIGRDRFSSAS